MNLLGIAQQYLGTQETQGISNNATILNWAYELGISYTSDATPWCALFTSYILYKAGFDSIKSLRARDFLKAGTPVDSPEPGDIAVLWRDSPSSANGHVGIVSSISGSTITLLGGNQSDSVSYATFPTSRVLGYRRMGDFSQTAKTKPTSRLKPFLGFVTILVIIGLGYFIYTKFRK